MVKRGRGSACKAVDPQVGEDPVGRKTPAGVEGIAVLFETELV